MSSSYVRTQITSFIGTELPAETVIDLTAEYREIEDVISGASLTYKDPWLGMQFIGSEDIPINVGANNVAGCYRETGIVMLHVVAQSNSLSASSILTRAESIRDAFRGQRINDIIIESVSPPNFERGVTLDFESGYTSAVITVSYERDLNL